MAHLDPKILSIGAVLIAIIIAIGVVILLVLGKPDQGLGVMLSSVIGAIFGGSVVHVAASSNGGTVK